MARPRHESGAVAWVCRWWRPLVSEALSTALLVSLGCGSTLAVRGPGSAPLTHPALAFGFLVLGNVCAFGAASGAHMNPAVTLAAALCGQLAPLPALAYALAQCAGATLGSAALLAVTPSKLATGAVGLTAPAPDVSALAALFIEVALTGTLVLAVCGLWADHDPRRPDPTVGVKLGLVVAGLIYVGGPATGASLNPARSLGPALMQNAWSYQWVYWAGPLLGSLLATLLHQYVLAPRPAPAPGTAPDPELRDVEEVEVPLNDKP